MTVELKDSTNQNSQAGTSASARELKQQHKFEQAGMGSLWEMRQLISLMVKRDLVSRYKGSLLGAFWPLINPLGHLLLYTFVFSIILKVRFGDSTSTGTFALYLMTGLIPWGAFAEAITRSTTVVLESPNLVKRVVFPLEILPLVTLLSSLLSQLIALPILVIAVAISIGHLHATLLYLPLIIVSQILFTGGLSWILGSLGVYIRDIRHFMSLGLSAWMYATPIVYPASAMPEKLKFLIVMNPMAGIVDDYRRVIIEGLAPNWQVYSLYTAIGLIAWFSGYYFFYKTKRSFADIM